MGLHPQRTITAHLGVTTMAHPALAPEGSICEILPFLECEVGHKSWRDLLAELEGSGIFVTDPVKGLMWRWQRKEGQTEKVKFGKEAIRSFGFSESPTVSVLAAGIANHGYKPCEFQDAAFIRQAWNNQDTSLGVLCPVKNFPKGGEYHPFRLGRGQGGPGWLHVDYIAPSGPEATCGLDQEVIFRLA